jgi:hypothetical protein
VSGLNGERIRKVMEINAARDSLER